ncbi:MAG: TlpA family protein disulfide reductase [Halioglobus sp.]|nr:TlpA family protein disulfide reductase [Halioglobus sp.]
MHTARIATITALAALLTLSVSAARAVDFPGFIDQHRGKVVLVDFWASWCVPCRRSFPWLNDMQEKYASDGLVIIGVNEDNDQANAAAFLNEYPARFRIIPDPDGKLAARFELLAMPSSYLIGRDGTQLANHLGFKTAKVDEYEKLLREALGLQAEQLAAQPMTGDPN